MTPLSPYGWTPKLLFFLGLMVSLCICPYKPAQAVKWSSPPEGNYHPQVLPTLGTHILNQGSPQKHGSNWTAHRLIGEAKPCPWLVQQITRSKTPPTSVDTILIKKVSSWNMPINRTFSMRHGFSSCNFWVNTEPSIVSCAAYWLRRGQYLCHRHLVLASSPYEQFSVSLHFIGKISSNFIQYEGQF